ncbi:MAG: TonB-linked SusC/RagA family outer membrane protein [Vicingaceae bacterium]|jgi:TonB-linked SusC/RagA family outer membrane protein
MKHYFLVLAAICCSFTAFSQFTISGIVYDNNNSTLPGASVVIEGTNQGVSTTSEGTFKIEVPTNSATLVVSFLGFEPQEIEVNFGVWVKAVLQPSSQQIDEIVVTALGVKRDQRNLGYALQKINSNDIIEVQAVNFVDNLAAKVAGVAVSQGATGVGSTSKITIRGEASFTNNNPLFVVDGTPINNNTIVPFTTDAAAGFQEIDFGNGAMEINPDDVESVSVLKGPSAAALYGTRAANGVILITTKDGSGKRGIGVSFNSTNSVETAFRLPQFQNSYGQGNSGEFEFVDGLGGGTNDNISYSWGPRTDGRLIPQFTSAAGGVRGGDVAVHGGAIISATPFLSYGNNVKDFYQVGNTHINNLAITNTFDGGNMRLSYTDLRSNSIIPEVNLDRKNLAARLNINASDRLKVSSSINYVNSQSDNRPSNGYGSENANYSLVAWGPRSLDIGALKDYWQPGLEGLQQYNFNYTFFDNPYFILQENTNSFNRDRIFGNVMASYQMDEYWSLSLRSGMDYSTELRQFKRAFSTNRFKQGAYAEHQVGFRENNTDFLVNYNRKFGKISTDFSAGANRLDQRATTAQTQTTQLAQPGVYSLTNAASPIQVFQVYGKKRINSVYGIAKFGYENYLYVDVTARNDWSSALATISSSENTSFFYPSVSMSFITSHRFDLPQKISFLKFRANVAQVGNDTDPYQTQGVFNAQTPVNGQPTLSDQSTIPNQNLKPEQATSFETGFDFRMFDDRLIVDFTYYNAVTKNQIISLPVSVTSGYTQQVVNGGEVRSQGIEVVLMGKIIKKKDFEWTTTLNFSRNVATVESLPQSNGRLTLGYSGVYDNTNQRVWFQVEEGGQVGDMYGTGYKRTADGTLLLNDQGALIADNELKKLGNYNPDFILGIGNRFKYKRWDANILLDWRQGGIIVSRTQALAGVAGQLEETEFRPETGFVIKGVVNKGTDANPIYEQNTTAVSAESYYRQYYDRNHEENNTFNATYIKIREVAFGYTFPADKNTGIWKNVETLKISLIGRNIFAFSEIPHFDPEQVAVQGQQFVSGVEDMSYATSRSIGIKLGVNF